MYKYYFVTSLIKDLVIENNFFNVLWHKYFKTTNAGQIF